ncbi:MAG: IS30 family transposase [Gammaproteobacteria bacterium]|nr:IS30 family transposase [Gammaproteobacteria bacterium]
MGTNYKHLSCEERAMIQLHLEQGCTLRAIARSVQRAPSSISRELRRNGWSNPATVPRKRGRPPVAGGYRAPLAQQRADALATLARCPPRLARDGPLWSHVERLLRALHSPEQIAGILRRMNPDEPTLQVSHETIYTALYAMPRGALRTELIACLRQARKSRRPRARGEDRRGTIPNMTSIHRRPPEIDARIIPGHWEGDLIKGARNASAVGTLVERTTLFVTLARLDNASAAAAVTGFSTVLNRVAAQRRLSMTYDQGREMAHHARLSELTGVMVYFADPHSPWQRGINENTNGLLRQYFPKGMDLSGFTQAELDAVAWQLNTRPRKTLGWKCPAELFMPESFDFFKHHHQLVALRT